MSLLGSNLYCVPYGDPPLRVIKKRRRQREEISPAARLRQTVIVRGRIISIAEHAHELSLPDHDAVIRLVLCDEMLDLRDNPRGGSKLVVPAQVESKQ